jgi:hypothetical protein
VIRKLRNTKRDRENRFPGRRAHHRVCGRHGADLARQLDNRAGRLPELRLREPTKHLKQHLISLGLIGFQFFSDSRTPGFQPEAKKTGTLAMPIEK